MKKIFTILAALVCLIGCNKIEVPSAIPEELMLRETEVYVNGLKTQAKPTTKSGGGCDDKYTVYFYIRIDGNIPGSDAGLYPANEYFPRTKQNGSMFSDLNKGYARKDADWRSNEKLSKYVFATDGIAVKNVLLSEPSISNLIEADKHPDDNFSGVIDQIEDLHVIWYVCKKQTDAWHVDGILTRKEITDVKDTSFGETIVDDYKDFEDDTEPTTIDGTVDVDIHQQEHKDWDEIKTSIHIRSEIDSVIVKIPISGENFIQKDDFAIRTYEAYYTIEDVVYPIEVKVEFNLEEAVIKVKDIEHAVVRDLLDKSGDGLTVEVHMYPVGLPKGEIWEDIKRSEVLVGKKEPEINVTISSAYFDD